MRPAGTARVALVAVLQAGVVGHCEVIAQRAGVPTTQARYTLKNLCREKVAAAVRPGYTQGGAVGRPRVLYALHVPASHNPVAALASAVSAWR